MEDILHLYSLPLDEQRPVVCFDELPVQLLDARSCTAGNESWKARPLRL